MSEKGREFLAAVVSAVFIAVVVIASVVAVTRSNKTERNEDLPEGVKKISEKVERVSYYTVSTVKDGIKAEFQIVRAGNVYYALPMKLVNGTFERIEPKVSLVPVKGDFLREVERSFTGFNFTVKGKGKNVLYVIFDAFCPYCMEGIKRLPELKKQYSLIVFLPLAVHGEASIQGLSCIYGKAEKEGMEKALTTVLGWKQGKSWKEYKEKISSCRADESVKNAVKEASNLLSGNGVYATPTFFLLKDGRFYKRIGIPDFSLIEEKHR